jgi:hypothetical protein
VGSNVSFTNLKKNCIIGPCDWFKLQITHCDIKNNCKVFVFVVGKNYKLISEFVFRLQTYQSSSDCHISPNKNVTRVTFNEKY